MRRNDLHGLGGPAGLFDAFTRRSGGAVRRQLGESFEVVALPGERLDDDLREGDMVIRRALGEGDLAWLTEIGISAPPAFEPGVRLPFDQLVLRPIGEQVAAPGAAPDSPVANRFIAAHASRYCTPGQPGSKTCRSLPSPRPIGRVIVHVLAVPSTTRRSGVEAVVAGWQNAGREASSHYLVDRDGTITQMVREANVAFHTPGNNPDSIGIEHADVCNDPAPFTTQLYERSAALVRDIAARNGFVISPTTVLGHHDANPNHGDPGPYWDWEYYRLLLAWDGQDRASRPVRVVNGAAGAQGTPTGWQVGHRRAIPNDHCASRRDPWGERYWKARPAASAAAAELSLPVDEPGTYSVSLWWPDVAGANPAATVEIETGCLSSPCLQTSSTQIATVDQRRNFGRWNVVATVTIDGPPAEVKVRLRRDAAQPGWILCDGARLLRIATLAPQTPARPGPLGPEGDPDDAVVLDRFASDSASLTAAHRAALAQLASTIVGSQSGSQPVQSIDLTGHTDSSGDVAYNLEVARKRAAAAEAELRRQIETLSPGLTARLTFRPSSQGEASPVASNSTADGKARNRRVEVRLGRGRIEPVAVSTITVPVSSGGSPVSEDFTEQAPPPDPVLIPLGPGGHELVGTGTPLPVGAPAYTWSVIDATVARASLDTDSQTHPNFVTVLGLRPGQTVLRQVYRASVGPPATFDLPIVVAGIEMSLLDPVGPAEPPTDTNELVRPIGRANGVAHRSVLVQLQPAAALTGKTLEWTFVPDTGNRQALPAGRSILEQEGTFAFTAGSAPASGTSVIDGTGKAAVKVNLPNVAFNRGRLVAAVTGSSGVSARIDLEVPGVVVVDPGHGGSRSIPDSSSNNAKGVVSNVLEKTLALDLGLKLRDALLASPRLVKVFMTRDCDVNIGGIERAVVARCKGADVFLSIHLNGGAATVRGTSTFVRALTNGNVNRPEDFALAQRVQTAVVAAIPGGADLGVLDDTHTKPKSLAVLNDANLGNTTAFHPTRACLVEVEFLSNDAADRQFNQAANRETLKLSVAQAIADAIVADLTNQP